MSALRAPADGRANSCLEQLTGIQQLLGKTHSAVSRSLPGHQRRFDDVKSTVSDAIARLKLWSKEADGQSTRSKVLDLVFDELEKAIENVSSVLKDLFDHRLKPDDT